MSEHRRAGRWPRSWRLPAAVVGVALFALILWGGTQLWSARGHLLAAQAQAETLKASLGKADDATLAASVRTLQAETRAARASLNDPVLRVFSAVPVLGRNISGAQVVAEELDTIAHSAVPGLVSIARDLRPDKLVSPDGQVDVDLLSDAEPHLLGPWRVLVRSASDLNAIKTGWMLPPVSSAVRDVQDRVGDVLAAVHTARRTAGVAPEMLGGDGARRYLLVFQTNAELRPTGGLPGAWAELIADDGRLSLGKQGVGGDIVFDKPVVPLSDDETYLFTDKLGTEFRDINFTPHWPRSAEIARAMIKEDADLGVDGVISVDPVAMSYLLPGTGPIQPAKGPELTTENLVDVLLNRVYFDHPDPKDQDVYFALVTQAMFKAMTKPTDARALLQGLSRGAGERRILVWSRYPNEQDELASGPIGGVLPTGPSNMPHIGFYLADVSASKMDYYLHYDVDVEAANCRPDGTQSYDASLTLKSTAPANGLPAYVTGRRDAESGLKAGELTVALDIFAPHGGKVTDVTVRGQKPNPDFSAFAPATYLGRGIGETTVTLKPGEQTTLDVSIMSGPRSRGQTTVHITPSGDADTATSQLVRSACR